MTSSEFVWKGDRLAPWLLILLVLAVYLPGTAQLPLVDRDEPRFATAAREMMDRRDWIVPTFNGADRFDKPALVYWLMRAGYSTVGVGELGARLPAVACMIALVLLVWHTGRRWFGGRAGFAAGLMLATSLQFFIHGRLAVADMPMVLSVAVACVALVELLLAPDTAKGRGRVAWWSLWIAIGVGFLAKGPIALAVPALALVFWRWVFWRKPLPWARLKIGRGLLLATGIVAVWGVPALVVTHGRFWDVGMGEHVVQRGFEKFNGRSYNPFFYLMTAPLSLFPWIVFAGVAGWGARRNWDVRRAWLVSWLLAPYVIFTCYATQLPHYVLPGFPAFFILVGAVFAPETLAGVKWPRWLGRVMAGVLVLVGLGVVIGLVLVGRAVLPAGLEPLRAALLGLLAVLSGFVVVAAAWWRSRGALVAVGVLLLTVGAWRMGSGLRAVSPAVTMRGRWGELPADTRYLGWRFAEPSLVFYSGQKWDFRSTTDNVAAALARPGPVVVVALERECDPLVFFTGRVRWRDVPPPDLGVTAFRLQELEAFNLGRSRWQHISVWLRP
ncbi:MAG: glycosyltransferase family 39 protein [Opitutaceae bacterium]|jgi:4-amino-4-deoxy-L-arabinose transferase-like glycosyltransferase